MAGRSAEGGTRAEGFEQERVERVERAEKGCFDVLSFPLLLPHMNCILNSGPMYVSHVPRPNCAQYPPRRTAQHRTAQHSTQTSGREKVGFVWFVWFACLLHTPTPTNSKRERRRQEGGEKGHQPNRHCFFFLLLI